MTAAHLWVLRYRKASVDAHVPSQKPLECKETAGLKYTMYRLPGRRRRGARTRVADGFVGSTTVNDGPISIAVARTETAGVSLWCCGVSTQS